MKLYSPAPFDADPAQIHQATRPEPASTGESTISTAIRYPNHNKRAGDAPLGPIGTITMRNCLVHGRIYIAEPDSRLCLGDFGVDT